MAMRLTPLRVRLSLLLILGALPGLALVRAQDKPPAKPADKPKAAWTSEEARAQLREYFSSHLRNPNTRRANPEAVRQFSSFCAEHGIVNLAQVEPVHVAAFLEAQLKLHAKPTVKQRLAALRMLFESCRTMGC